MGQGPAVVETRSPTFNILPFSDRGGSVESGSIARGSDPDTCVHRLLLHKLSQPRDLRMFWILSGPVGRFSEKQEDAALAV